MSLTDTPQSRVVRELLHTGPALYCYRNDAEFHAQVDALAAAMLGMVGQLVVQSEERKRYYEQQIETLMKTPPALDGLLCWHPRQVLESHARQRVRWCPDCPQRTSTIDGTEPAALAPWRFPPGDEKEVVHRCPIGDSAVTACCDRTPFELPMYHRVTRDPALVTCPGARSSTGQPASGPAAQ